MDNYTYTLGSFRTAVFRVLDEYSANGINTERFSGALSDIDKRFITALNCAVRRIYISVSRTPIRKRICFIRHRILFEKNKLTVKKDTSERIVLPELSGAVSFFFCGKGTLTFYSQIGEPLSEYSLISEYGEIESFKIFVPDEASYLGLSTDAVIDMERIRIYSSEKLDKTENTALLPDGKNLFCSFSENMIEISGLFRDGRRVDTDILHFDGNLLSCDERYAGSYDIVFYAYPDAFYENSPDAQPVPLSPSASDAAVYAVAAELCESENGELYSRLIYKYREILANTYPTENIKIKNKFFAGYSSRKKRKSFWG